ncbi:helix-turn-helix domain-containing protein [Nonomuraea polychroma]|uniref:helix-turn-helix domain-containing protein n=1 Tax=Nonomuraea polychroma TaxID=46176 RepID=UPI003D950149
MTGTDAAPTRRRPTLDEIRSWPPTVNAERAALALGVSRAYAYQCIKNGIFPARTVAVGKRIVVLTSSILAILEEEAGPQS